MLGKVSSADKMTTEFFKNTVKSWWKEKEIIAMPAKTQHTFDVSKM